MQFWEIMVGLGVPGLAFGVLYMLFKGFKWDLTKKGPRHAAIVFMVLVTGLVWSALIIYGPRNQEPYVLLVTVHNQEGLPVSNVEIQTDTTEQIRRLDNAWEVVVRDREEGDTVTVYATSGFSNGKATPTLGSKKKVRVPITLTQRTDATISGKVTDPDGNPVSEAVVSVLGHEPEGVQTGEKGHFKLKTHAAPGEEVRITAEKGTLSWRGYLPAGESVEIRLIERKP